MTHYIPCHSLCLGWSVWAMTHSKNNLMDSQKNLHYSVLLYVCRPCCFKQGESLRENHWEIIAHSCPNWFSLLFIKGEAHLRLDFYSDRNGLISHRKKPASTEHTSVWRKGWGCKDGSLPAALSGQTAILMLACKLRVKKTHQQKM